MVYLIFWNHPDICMTCSFLWSISRFVGAGIRSVLGKCDKSLVAQKPGDLDFAKIVRRGELWRDGNFASFTVFLDVSRYFMSFVAFKSFLSGFVRRKNLDESVGYGFLG